MAFQNEATFWHATQQGGGDAFHARFDEALGEIEEGFGEVHPLHIGSRARTGLKTFADRSPSDPDRVLGHFQQGGREEVAQAIGAASEAFRTWSTTDWKERVALFRKAADLLARDKFSLAALMCHENGKNRLEAMADVDEAIDFLRWYTAEMEANEGFAEEMGRAGPEERTRSVLRPYGVWAVIAPFNFPLAITCGMTTGAALTGNTVVLKPASETPLIGLRFFEALREAGVPEGVINFVTGPGGTAGAAMVESPRVAGLVFTGSRAVGIASFRAATASFAKPVITELGGKNPVIVTDQADLVKAVPGVGLGAFGFGGQKCSATSRVYVHEPMAEAFTSALIAWTEELIIGDPTAAGTYLGPLINRQAYENFQEYAGLAAKEGRVLIGGDVVGKGPLAKGYFVSPTVVAGLPTDHRLFREELFVPLVCLATIPSLEAGLDLANDSEYGLCAGIFTEDETERDRFFQEIEAGVAYCNRAQGATTGALVGAQPFGGWKHSGISGKGAGGRFYLPQFMREQSQTHYV